MKLTPALLVTAGLASAAGASLARRESRTITWWRCPGGDRAFSSRDPSADKNLYNSMCTKANDFDSGHTILYCDDDGEHWYDLYINAEGVYEGDLYEGGAVVGQCEYHNTRVDRPAVAWTCTV